MGKIKEIVTFVIAISIIVFSLNEIFNRIV